MKKIICILIVLSMVLTMAACDQTKVTEEAVETPTEKATEEETTAPPIDDPDYIPDSEFTQTELEIASYWKDYRGQGKSFTLVKGVPAGDTTLPESDTVNDNAWTRYFEINTGIKVDVSWSASGDAFDQKLNMSIASGDIPDYLEVNINQWRILAKSGMLADLTDFYENNMPPIQRNAFLDMNDSALDAVSFAGKILGYPSIQPGADSGALLWLRTDWLEKLNLDEPVTYEDVGKIALAFANNDPDGNGINDTTGLIINPEGYTAAGTNSGYFGEMFVYYNAYPHMWMTDDSGTVSYGSVMPGAADALIQLNKWYEEGAIHEEWTSLGDDIFKPIAANECGIFFGPWWMSWPLGDSVVNDPDAQWKSYGIARPDGNFYVGMTDPATTIGVINMTAEDPEMIWQCMIGQGTAPVAAIRSKSLKAEIDEAGSEAMDSGLSHSYNPFRVIVDANIYIVEDDYRWIKGLLDETITWDDVQADFEKFGMTFDLESEYNLSCIQSALRVAERDNPYEDIGDWTGSFGYAVGVAPMAADNRVSQFNAFIGQTTTMESKWTYLDKLETEAYTRMILGETDGLSVQEYFDQFVVEWKAQGGNQITSEVQAEIDSKK